MRARIQDPDGNRLFDIPLNEAQAAAIKGEMYLHGRSRRLLIFRLNYQPGVIKHLDPSTLTLKDMEAYVQLRRGEHVPRRRRERLQGYGLVCPRSCN